MGFHTTTDRLCGPDPRAQKLLSDVESIASLGQKSNGKDGGVEDRGSGHPQRKGREGDVGRGLEADGMPQTHAPTLEHQVREDRPRATAEERQPVARNRATRAGKVDSGSVAQSLQLHLPRRGHGNTRGEVRGG